MDDLLAVSIMAGMGGTLLVLFARLRGALLDRDLGVTPKD
jgi:hypothetical protein